MSETVVPYLPDIEGYRLLNRVGKGGVGVVYSAIDLETDEQVAIKVLKVPTTHQTEEESTVTDSQSSQSSTSSISAQRLFQELIAATRIQHEHVVKVLDFGVSESNELYIVMTFLRGMDFAAQLKQVGPFSVTETLQLFLPVLEALAIAHQQNLVHQDLKPSNLFLTNTSQGRKLIITDFGIARRVKEDHTDQVIMGSLPYMAPEYLQHRMVSTAGDVYQLGLTLVELLSGQRVIKRKGAVQIMYQHISGEFKIPPALQYKKIGGIITKAIALDPKQRFKNAGELLYALTQLTTEEIQLLEFELQHPEQVKKESIIEIDLAPIRPNLEKSLSEETSNSDEGLTVLKHDLEILTKSNQTLREDKRLLMEKLDQYEKETKRQRFFTVLYTLVFFILLIVILYLLTK